MTNDAKMLSILFYRLHPEAVLNMLAEGRLPEDNALSGWYRGMAETDFAGYSAPEQMNLFALSYQESAGYVLGAATKPGNVRLFPPWCQLVRYSDQVLDQRRGTPVCRQRTLLDWREIYLRLGQDIFTAAWLAHSDVRDARQRRSFDWPLILHTDNAVVEDMLDAGIAENHCHCYANSAVFALNWASMMNHPKRIFRKEFQEKHFGTSLRSDFSRGYADNVWTIEHRVLMAAKLRVLLFGRLAELERCPTLASSDFQRQLKLFCRISSGDLYTAEDIETEADVLRALYGISFPQPPDGSRKCCIDYAFSGGLSGAVGSPLRLPAAERYFLYRCFRACFQDAFDCFTQWAFYAYLLLKTAIRAEFIQVNGETGFENFHNYDDRKASALSDAEWAENYIIGINYHLETEKLISLEARLVPDTNWSKMVNKAFGIDRCKLFFDGKQVESWLLNFEMKNEADKEPYHYIWHFPKKQDAVIRANDYDCGCRHEALRKQYRETAVTFVHALNSPHSEYFRQRTCGIDACSQELFCRPEVFGSVFRYIRAAPTDPDWYEEESRSGISFTYHAGEDFWDIPDGLRAIDEALLFLDMKRGDRLGHAIALAVPPEVHYRSKGMRVAMYKQDRLDELVWLLFRAPQFNISIPSVLYHRMKNEAEQLLESIYGVSDHGAWSLRQYYHSWLLRGDAPSRYRDIDHIFWWDGDPYDYYALNSSNLMGDLNPIRNNVSAARLYSQYHYSYEVRRKGSERISAEVDREYIQLAAEMQTAMQRYLNELGICVECCPSSNVLIGTFSDYRNHPVFRLNGPDGHTEELHVSINSDDAGVFDTSLRLEYHLIGATMSEMEDQTHTKVYTPREMEAYLKKLREMSLEQRFHSFV